MPVSLGDAPWPQWLPASAQESALSLQHWVVENAKTARAQLKAMGHPGPIAAIDIQELPRTPKTQDLDALLAPALAGQPLGLMSEAGCPAIADPGALLVRRAHERHIPVKAHVGPSSLLLALMASGLDGQRFAFHGYLPVKEDELHETIKRLEKESARLKQTQVFIETPYRNGRTFQALLEHSRSTTRLCLAAGMTTAQEWVKTRSIHDWQRSPNPGPQIDKIPTVFCLLA